jgi:hypothetical protein
MDSTCGILTQNYTHLSSVELLQQSFVTDPVAIEKDIGLGVEENNDWNVRVCPSMECT